MSKHTPGPWRVGINQHGGAHIVSDEHGLIGETVGGGNCGLQLNEGGKAQSLVNARLIAAAPDMLEALRNIDAWASGFAGECTLDVIRDCVRRTVAKAVQS